MPGEKLNQVLDDLEVSVEQRTAIKKEMAILEKSLIADTALFKLKLQKLIDELIARKVSTEQVVNVLLDDFDNDGPIFGALKNSIVSDVQGTMKNIDTRITVDEWEQELEKRPLLTWICALVNTCDDCLPLHGVSKFFEEWEADPGLPGSGWSVCGKHCQCVLMEKSVAGSFEELRQPIKREKREIREIAKAKDVDSVTAYTNRKLGRLNNPDDSLSRDKEKFLRGES